MVRFEVEDAPARIAEIVEALQLLTHSPLIGRESGSYIAICCFVYSLD